MEWSPMQDRRVNVIPFFHWCTHKDLGKAKKMHDFVFTFMMMDQGHVLC